jgi:ATP-binding cassette subfamily B (MDR/TAP) protein 1
MNNMVCKFQKSLYGLKQSPREWNHKIIAYFLSQKFERSYGDCNVYFKRIQENSYVIINFYVVDLILAFNDLFLLK